MKRSEAVQVLRNAVLTHMNCGAECCGTDEVMYGRILGELEEVWLRLTDNETVIIYEPEDGWDTWIEAENRAAEQRDFLLVEGGTERARDISKRFLDGESFEQLAKSYNVTRERIRQIVAKERRRYQRSLEGK